MNPKMKIAILGGTGKEGKGLAYRWARAGYEVIIGSRLLEKAQTAVKEIKDLAPGQNLPVEAMENLEAAQKGELVVLTVPYAAHKDMLNLIKDAVAGKIVVDVTVPLVPPKVTKVQMPPAGSACLEARQILGEEAKLVAAFQNISYEKLLNDEEIECDILVCGHKDGRGVVIDLIKDMGLIAWDAGVLENSVVVEGMTSILIGINKQFGIQSAGIKITGVPK
jgi:8-hydroxy-5-deazaflavin:NADPH oxidoreductase